MLNIINKLIKISIYLIFVLIIIGFFWNYYYLFDLFSHFYLQYFISSILLMIFYVYNKSKLEIILSLIIIIFLFFNIYKADFSWIFWWKNIQNPDIFYMNTKYLNKNNSIIYDNIKKIKPKEIILVELDKELFEKIKNTFNFKYDFYYKNSYKSFWFFTNETILDKKIIIIETYPIWYFKLNNISYYIIHPFPPFTNEDYQKQKKFFNYINKLIKNEKNNFLLIWDFNSTNYSQVFKSNFNNFHYKIIYSWIVDNILTIPIDYVISNKQVNVFPGNKLSSDHVPLLINF